MKKLVVSILLGMFVLTGLAYAVAPNNMQPNTMQRLIRVKFYYMTVTHDSDTMSAVYRPEAYKTFNLVKATGRVVASAVTDTNGYAAFTVSCPINEIGGAAGPGAVAVGSRVYYYWYAHVSDLVTTTINTAANKIPVELEPSPFLYINEDLSTKDNNTAKGPATIDKQLQSAMRNKF